MNKVDGKPKSISEILKGSKFSLDYYQREYRWKTDQITQLLDDLSGRFLAYYEPNHGREQGADYGHYFLGSIIINDEGRKQFIIDGQQRLTSLTLLLIYIYHNLEANENKYDEIRPLIFSSKRSAKSFNIDIKERRECMEALLDGGGPGDVDAKGKSESIANILDRYEDIENNFPEKLAGRALPHFAYWLIYNVDIIQITTSSNEDAYTIFETMNDRGLHLTPTEMLKGYLLSRITDNNQREKADEAWRKQIISLQEIPKGTEEDANAIKAWLRSQYAQSQKDTAPRDFDKIGSRFHRWVSDKVSKKELDRFDPDKKDSFFDFITRDFRFYGEWYKFIRKVAVDFDLARKENVEAIHYNFHIWNALWYMLLLAPLNKSDSDEGDNIIRCKLQIVSSFLDILIARRLWNGNANGRSVSTSTIRDMIIRLTQEIRGKSTSELITILTRELGKTGETFESNETLALHGQNRPHIRYLLARMTDYVQTQSGGTSRYRDYIETHEVEHIWAKKKYKEHGFKDEQEQDFLAYRNRIGGLLLLPKEKNTSLGSKPYTDRKDKNASLKDKPYTGKDGKREDYFSFDNNPLAYSLHERAYKPGVGKSGFQKFNQQFKNRSKLEFEPHPEFKKKDLDKRQELYRELCKQIWNPEILRNPLKKLKNM